MISEQLNKTLSGIAGEYFAAAELSRHGLVAAVTLRNTRGIDIVVSRAGKSGSATVQVKTVQNGPAKWLLNKSDEKSQGPNHILRLRCFARTQRSTGILGGGRRVMSGKSSR
jgi:hypothetical protein